MTPWFIEHDDVPVIPVSGEMHYSRVPRDQWRDRLNLMKAGGITVVATYALWIHHEPHRGGVSFAGRLDIAAFISLCAELGLAVVVRIGPWCHGEVRNGGFPDWVQAAPVQHRTDDPAYLALIEPWLRRLGHEVAPFCQPEGPVLAVQLENELYDQPGHISTLKRLAIESGIIAPFYTATAWGGANLPLQDVVPLFGGYGDGFWVDADEPWDPSFRAHFFFSHAWDDPGIGADLRSAPQQEVVTHRPYPPATCELGGGMATAYHRRPRPTGLDIAAVAHNKIGSGSAWQGYYMYTGGTNPTNQDHSYTTGLQESHDTGYPNDLPQYDYDFHAPIGASGRLNTSHNLLRRQHAFLAAFGPSFAPMESKLPDRGPTGIDDMETLRWAIRSDGSSGFIFITWHQPYIPLNTYEDAQFDVTMSDKRILFPPHPVAVPSGTIAHWPLGLVINNVELLWATASPLTTLQDGTITVLVLTAEHGIPLTWEWADNVTITRYGDGEGDASTGPGRVTRTHVYRCSTLTTYIDVLVLPSIDADQVWVLGDGTDRQVVLSEHPIWLGAASLLNGRTTALEPEVHRYQPSTHAFVPVRPRALDDPPSRQQLPVTLLRPAGNIPPSYGDSAGRGSAPTQDTIHDLAAIYEIGVPRDPGLGHRRRELEIVWAGDVAQLSVDNVVVADRFLDGSPWIVDIETLKLGTDSTLILNLLPLNMEHSSQLPEALPPTRELRDQQQDALSVELVEWHHWLEDPPDFSS
ncbi:beta-galactosidase [Arthrobacter sp. CP30]